MDESLSDFFRFTLKAPLANDRWSWGGVGPSGVFLRVWQKDFDGQYRLKRALINETSWGDPGSLGYPERVRHVEAIEGGSPGYLVVLQGYWDVSAGHMVTEGYDESYVFRISRIIREGDKTYAAFDAKLQVRDVTEQLPPSE